MHHFWLNLTFHSYKSCQEFRFMFHPRCQCCPLTSVSVLLLIIYSLTFQLHDFTLVWSIWISWICFSLSTYLCLIMLYDSSPWIFDLTSNPKTQISPSSLPCPLPPWPCCSSARRIYDLTLLTSWVSGNRTWLLLTILSLILDFPACLAFWPCCIVCRIYDLIPMSDLVSDPINAALRPNRPVSSYKV